MWSALSALAAIVGALLGHWLKNAPNREEQANHAATQGLRKAITDGDADYISQHIDRLRTKNRLRHRHKSDRAN